MKKYLEFANETFGWKKKQKTKTYDRDSDQEMEELIEEIKNTFNVKNLGSSGSRWVYQLNNDVRIELSSDSIGSKNWKFSINGKTVETSLISDKYFEELHILFADAEKKEKILRNNEIFNKAIKTRRDAAKYNL